MSAQIVTDNSAVLGKISAYQDLRSPVQQIREEKGPHSNVIMGSLGPCLVSTVLGVCCSSVNQDLWAGYRQKVDAH